MNERDTRETPRRGRPVDREAREGRIRHLLASARRCFLAKGFHAASTADISREAGVSVASLYQHFASKDDLIRAMAEQDLREDLAFVEAITRAEDVLAGIGDAFEAIADAAGRDEGFGLRVDIFAEAVRKPQVRATLAAIEETTVAALARAVAAGQSRGQIRAELDPVAVAAILVRLVDGLYSGAAAGIADTRAMLPTLGALLRSGLAPRRDG